MATRSVDILLRARDRATGVFRRLDDVAGRLGRTLTLFGAGAVTGAAGGFALLTKNAFGTLDALGKLSDRIDGAPEEIRALQFAGEQTGTSAEGVAKSLTFLRKAVGEALLGIGEGKLALDELGLSAEDFARLPLDRQIQTLADRFAGLETQEQKVAIAQKLFGRSGVEMVNLLQLGGAGVASLVAEFNRLGPAIDRDGIAKVEEANDAMNRLKTSVSLLADATAVALAPAIASASNELTNFIADINRAGDSGISFIRLYGDEVARQLPFFSSLASLLPGVNIEDTGAFDRLRGELAKPITQGDIDANRRAAKDARERIRLAEEERLAKAKLAAEEARLAEERRMAEQAAAAEQARIAELERFAERILDDLKTDQERFAEQVERLREALKEGLLDQEQFDQAVERARQKLEDVTSPIETTVSVHEPRLDAVQERLLTGGGTPGRDPVEAAIDKTRKEIQRLIDVGLEQLQLSSTTNDRLNEIVRGAF